MRLFLSIFIFFTPLLALDVDFEVDNTNIYTKLHNNKGSNYNRLRVYGILEDEKYENFLAKIIIDNENRYDIAQDDNTNKTKIYRGYLKYSDDLNLIVIGKQRIPFGVGKIWNPTDIFNPIDATAIESDERKGIESLRYEYALSEVSNIDTTIAKDKQAFRIKGYVDIADIGFIVLKDKNKDQMIYGYEIQGELFDTGVELRSEGGYFYNKNSKDSQELIFGGEYSFSDLTILGEYKYNSLNNIEHLAANFTYTVSPLLTANATSIKNLDDDSLLTFLKFDYSLSDEMELNIGSYFYSGSNGSEYGDRDNSYFVRLFVHF